MSKIKAFGAFAYDFWWLIPVVLLVLLPFSLWRAVRKR